MLYLLVIFYLISGSSIGFPTPNQRLKVSIMCIMLTVYAYQQANEMWPPRHTHTQAPIKAICRTTMTASSSSKGLELWIDARQMASTPLEELVQKCQGASRILVNHDR